ncbi:MAG: hypothetical protein V7K40_23695 [Nostoc sp.]
MINKHVSAVFRACILHASRQQTRDEGFQISQAEIDSVKLHAQRILNGLAVERVWQKVS